MIKIENIQKSFGDNHVLKGISTQFEKGKTNLIIGQSGSGKTVLMKCLLGLYEIDEGHIFFDQKDYQNLDADGKMDIRRELGMVFQGSALFDSMTVIENVSFPLKMFTDQSESEMQDRAAAVLKRVNLKQEAFKRFPDEISGGMQKRVAIARAIVMNPNYLFCDEPNSGLDPKSAMIIDNLIQEITQA
jgi:phospholipid/cholesterol/gamma-HCH transport system ATP-binding protein